MGMIRNCANKRGTNVIKIHVHIDGGAMIALKSMLNPEFSMDYNVITANMKFYGGIFDMVNRDLQPYGVQVRGYFDNLSLDDYKVPYDKTKCMEGSPSQARSAMSRTFIQAKEKGQLGNRLLVFFCPNLLMTPPQTSILPFGTCDNIIGFTFGEIHQLKTSIYDSIFRMISRVKYKDMGTVNTSFNSELCRYTDNCISNSETVYGEYIRDLKSVRHLGTEEYILKPGAKLKIHDPNDDTYFLKAHGDGFRVFPTEDYSNEEELLLDGLSMVGLRTGGRERLRIGGKKRL
ncbi:hypothetical protein CWI37_1593p0010 [Hamiltosporidium tvaerminnensis]|uniref:Uncharacterized protein n=1 Tax=Hamiltosporidium tvaerminnensis TaxID=1176355 RepID=A0A4Q9KV80_9MICR|nr:hypothetical protein CWI37_1593p0010 [Hamiltosporidium tvaerminnensis]